MRRPIHELIETLYADEPLTAAEVERLRRYEPRVYEWGEFLFLPRVPHARRLRIVLRRRVLPHLSSPEDRRAVRLAADQLLEFAAMWDGRQREGMRAQFTARDNLNRARKKGHEVVQQKNAAELERFGDRAINAATVRAFLKHDDPTFTKASPDKQENRIEATVKRLNRARAKK